MAQFYEQIGDPQAGGPLVVSCEHASRALPPWLSANADDEKKLAEHWGWDIGAADLSRELVRLTKSCGVLAGFSRLAADANRSIDAASYILREVDGTVLSFNQGLSDAERAKRSDTLFAPYHAAIDSLLRQRLDLGPVHLLAIHSFTPFYQGNQREIEVGVLFNDYDEQAHALARALRDCEFHAVLNEPYTGKAPDGLIYSAKRHGEAHSIPYLELEIRQDLIDSGSKAAAVAQRMLPALKEFYPRQS